MDGHDVGDLVAWSGADKDVPKGTFGEVLGFNGSNDRVRVAFPKGTFAFEPHELHPFRKKFDIGDLVTWTGADKDIKEGEFGTVVKYDNGRVSVKFSKGQYSFTQSQLNPFWKKFDIGDFVTWTGADTDVPRGHKGRVLEYTDGRVRVNFPTGTYKFPETDLR